MGAPSDQLKFQLQAMRDLVAGVQPDQWTNSTPCPKWTVRDLVNHLVGGGQMFAASIRGEAASEPEGAMPDLLGDDPLAAVDATIAAFNAAADAPGALDGDVVLPFATLPAPVAIAIAKFDILVHCYDLATATGQPFDPPASVVDEGFQMAQMLITPELRNGDTFGAAVTAPDGASGMQRLAALAGREI